MDQIAPDKFSLHDTDDTFIHGFKRGRPVRSQYACNFSTTNER